MIRALRLTIAKLLTALLLTLGMGVQVLEATGHWDRTFQDAGDEAVIVTVVLCIGAVVAAVGTVRARFARSAARSLIMFVRPAPSERPHLWLPSTTFSSPPNSLRI